MQSAGAGWKVGDTEAQLCKAKILYPEVRRTCLNVVNPERAIYALFIFTEIASVKPFTGLLTCKRPTVFISWAWDLESRHCDPVAHR